MTRSWLGSSVEVDIAAARGDGLRLWWSWPTIQLLHRSSNNSSSNYDGSLEELRARHHLPLFKLQPNDSANSMCKPCVSRDARLPR